MPKETLHRIVERFKPCECVCERDRERVCVCVLCVYFCKVVFARAHTHTICLPTHRDTQPTHRPPRPHTHTHRHTQTHPKQLRTLLEGIGYVIESIRHLKAFQRLVRNTGIECVLYGIECVLYTSKSSNAWYETH